MRKLQRFLHCLDNLLSCTTTGKTTLSKHCATNELQLWDLDRLLHVWTRLSSPRLQPRNHEHKTQESESAILAVGAVSTSGNELEHHTKESAILAHIAERHCQTPSTCC